MSPFSREKVLLEGSPLPQLVALLLKVSAMPTTETGLPALADVLRDNPLFLDEGVDTAEAARITSVPAATLTTLRTRGSGPAFLKIGNGKSVRYTRRALLEWLNAGRRVSTSDSGPEAQPAAA